MTSQSKVQGVLKSVTIASLAVIATLASLHAEAQSRARPPRGGSVASPAVPTVRPAVVVAPSTPAVVVPPCKRSGPGITPC